jgi:hypothetical protein
MTDLPARHAAAIDLSTLPLTEAREQVVALLSHHFASGVLSMEEFERRVAVVYASTSSGQLGGLVTDLPVIAPPSESVPSEGRISAFLSHNARHGSMIMPRHLRVVVALGNIELDLRDATFAPGVSEIEVSATLGNVEITVPPGVRVECSGGAVLGSFESKPLDAQQRGVATPGTTVRVLGRAILASVEIHG